MLNSPSKTRWYQEPLMWLVLFFPTIAVIGGIVTISLAILSDDGLVVDNYYKQGLEINHSLAQEQAAIQHQLEATLRFEGQTLRIILTAQPNYTLPPEISLNFHYRTRAGFDKNLLLQRISPGVYQGVMPQLIIGGWIVELVADDWRLLGSLHIPVTAQEVRIK